MSVERDLYTPTLRHVQTWLLIECIGSMVTTTDVYSLENKEMIYTKLAERILFCFVLFLRFLSCPSLSFITHLHVKAYNDRHAVYDDLYGTFLPSMHARS